MSVFVFCDVCFLQPCGHLIGMADLLALLYVMFHCVFVTFEYSVIEKVWYLRNHDSTHRGGGGARAQSTQ